jgi:serine/threonine-protein phosphatase 2A regulatory subunit B''
MSPEALEALVEAETAKLLAARAASAAHASVAPTIPAFFRAKSSSNPLALELRNIAHRVALQYKERGLLEDDELEDLWRCVAGVVARRRESSAPRGSRDARGRTTLGEGTLDAHTAALDSRVSYEELLEARDAFAERLDAAAAESGFDSVLGVDDSASRVEHYFSARTFNRFARDEEGRIDGRTFMEFVVRHVALTQSRINLGCHDSDADGWLEESELIEFIKRSVATMSALRSLPGHFIERYCEIAVRRFMFAHDPKRRGRCRVSDVLTGLALADFNELHAADENDPRLRRNWFSLVSAQRTRETFVALDRDESGGLSREEFRRYTIDPRFEEMCDVQGLTSVFADRIFEAHSVKGPENARLAREAFANSGSPRAQDPFIRRSLEARRKNLADEMDFHAFLDFALAWSDKSHPASLAYFFRALDLNENGVLTNFEIWTFLKGVHDAWVGDPDNYDLDMLDVRDEIFDMVKPATPGRITLEDLKRCGCADVVIEILCDHTGFWKYDNRENLPHDDEEEEEGEEEEEDEMLVDEDDDEF